MPVIQVTKDGFKELTDRQTIVGPDKVQHPFNIVAAWPDEELAKVGVYRVARAEPAHGQRIKPGTEPRYEINPKDGRVVQVIDTEPDPDAAPPKPVKMAKATATVAKTLEEVRAEALRLVDRASVEKRERDPTIRFDHELKRAEAERFLADPEKKPDMTQYPYLNAAYATKVDGKTVNAIAKTWIRRSDEARLDDALADARRVKARAAIRAASTEGDIRFIVDGFNG